LHSWEHLSVDLLRILFFTKDDSSTWSTERFVSGPGLWLAFCRLPILERTCFRLGEAETPTFTLFIGAERGQNN